jgi:hypothetical protein
VVVIAYVVIACVDQPWLCCVQFAYVIVYAM